MNNRLDLERMNILTGHCGHSDNAGWSDSNCAPDWSKGGSIGIEESMSCPYRKLEQVGRNGAELVG